MTPDKRVSQIVLASQSNAQNRPKNTLFIKPHNFHILFSLHGDRTVNILLSAIFPCVTLFTWTRPGRQFRSHSALLLVNSNHQSRACQHDNRQAHKASGFSNMVFFTRQARGLLALRLTPNLEGQGAV